MPFGVFKIIYFRRIFPKMDIVPQLLLQVFLIFLNAVFACAEIAVLSFNEAKLSQMASNGNRKAKKLSKLTSKPAKFLATIQVAITLSGFLGSAFAADNFSDKLVSVIKPLVGDAISLEVLDKICVILITLVLSYFTLVFGELVPKRLAMKKAEKLALALATLISFISTVFAPIVWFLTVSTNGMLRLFGIDPNEKDETVTEEEIKLMVDAGSEAGAIDEDEKTLIRNVFEFDDLTAGELSTKRTDVFVLWMEETPEDWENKINDSRYTRYPICNESIDDVVAVLNAKDYFRLKDKSRENVMENATKSPYFVPENVKADVLFNNMKKNKDFLAVVLDEYGGMSGIVTVTDLLRCIVGDFNDDDGDGGEDVIEIAPLDEMKWQILGQTSIKDVNEALSLELDDEECDTFAGYVLSVLGTIPEDGSTLTVETDEMTVEIVEVAEHRIERTVVTLKPAETDEDEDE